MNDPFDRLDRAAENVIARARWESQNRRGLLWGHAALGLWAGTLILLFGGPRNIEELVGIWSRVALGVVGIIGALILGWGLLSHPRSITAEATGLAILGVWDLSFAFGIAGARALQHDFTPRDLLEPQPIGYVVAYPVAVYGVLAYLIGVHLWTLRRIK